LVNWPPGVPGALPSNSSEARVDIQYLNRPSVVSLNGSEHPVIRIEDPSNKIAKCSLIDLKGCISIFMIFYILF
jgi:hypothetical protein